MIFSSPVFLFIFLPLLLPWYFLAPVRLRNLILLLASLFFYAWGENVFVLLMLASISMNYIGGLFIDRTRGKRRSRVSLILFLSFNILLLVIFKYANFLADNLNVVLLKINVNPVSLDPVHLPIGISFFTFQAMSYLVDIYRSDAEVQKNPLNCSLYIALFPQLIAGPIVRYRDIAKQLTSRTVTLDKFNMGITLFIIGLGKKMLIANPMGEVADQIFSIPPEELSALLAWMGTATYTLQIYFDFSGYSDMAIGLGRLFGFEFPINFNYPYIARSFREFWRRWHISLSTWFRDYLYIPLGGNRKGVRRTCFNLLLVFFLCGLWHGASWNFVLWGLAHGFFLVIERTRFGSFMELCWRPIQHLYLLFAVMITWVLFRSDNIIHAKIYLAAMFGLHSGQEFTHFPGMFWSNYQTVVFCAGLIGATPAVHFLKNKIIAIISGSIVFRATFSLAAVFSLMAVYIASVMQLAAGTYNPFIYFRF